MSRRTLFRRGLSIAFAVVAILLAARDYLPTIIPQAATVSWPETSGKITRSRVVNVGDEEYRLSDSHFSVGYTYAVDGKEYTGHDYRLRSDATQGVWYAARLAQRFPLGETVPVYYDPAQPARSVLVRGLMSEDGQMFLVLVPLAGIILALIWGTLYEITAFNRSPATAGLQWRENGSRTELDVPLIEPWIAGATLIFAMPLLALIALALLVAATRNAALLDLIWIIWFGVIITVWMLFHKTRAFLRSPRWRISIDRAAGRVELPERATRDDRAPAILPLAQVTRFFATTMEQRRRKMAPRIFYTAMIEWRDPETEELRDAPVYESDYGWRAGRVADWLESQRTAVR
jgi:hypothetical protein